MQFISVDIIISDIVDTSVYTSNFELLIKIANKRLMLTIPRGDT